MTVHIYTEKLYLKIREKYFFKGKKKMNKKLTKKSKRITLRLTEEQYSILERKTNELNMEKSDFLRQLIIDNKINAKTDTQSIAYCLGNLNKISLSIETIVISLSEAKEIHKINDYIYKSVLDILITIKMQIRNLNCLQK